jgi:putative hydrolase
MIILGDYHTHTKYSRHGHGKGTILENASVANEKGLKQIAITDHGFNHSFYGVRRRDIPDIKEDILNAKEVTGVDILLGVEANLISLNGDIDVNVEDFEFLDILAMGFHKLVQMDKNQDFWKLSMSNIFSSPFAPSKEKINRNTTAFLKALDKYPIDILTHINYGFPVDALAVAKLAKEKGTYIELNGKRINISERDLDTMAGEGVKFILNSDAHTPDRVGECNEGLNLIFKLGIPLNQVANIDKLPKFQNKRG